MYNVYYTDSADEFIHFSSIVSLTFGPVYKRSWVKLEKRDTRLDEINQRQKHKIEAGSISQSEELLGLFPEFLRGDVFELDERVLFADECRHRKVFDFKDFGNPQARQLTSVLEPH